MPKIKQMFDNFDTPEFLAFRNHKKTTYDYRFLKNR